MLFVAKNNQLRAYALIASIAAISFFGTILVSLSALAVQTTINVSVYDGRTATFTPSVDSTSSNGTIKITGDAHNISQIMVYIDGIYSSTFPLEMGAPTFEINLQVSSGEHIVKLVAIDPFTSGQIEHILTVSYTPGSTPVIKEQGSPRAGQIIKDVTRQSGEVAQATIDEFKDQLDSASNQGPMKDATDGLYNGLVDMGVVSPDSPEQTTTMVGRIIVIVMGLLLVIIPWQIYRLLIKRLPFVPRVDTRSYKVTLPIRLVGVTLVLLPFVFMQ